MPKKRQPSVWNTHKKHYILQVLGAFSKTLILLGFVWIDEKGKSAPTNEACAINCALKGAEFSTFYVVWLHQKGRKSAPTNNNCPTSCPLTEGGDFGIFFFFNFLSGFTKRARNLSPTNEMPNNLPIKKVDFKTS